MTAPNHDDLLAPSITDLLSKAAELLNEVPRSGERHRRWRRAANNVVDEIEATLAAALSAVPDDEAAHLPGCTKRHGPSDFCRDSAEHNIHRSDDEAEAEKLPGWWWEMDSAGLTEEANAELARQRPASVPAAPAERGETVPDTVDLRIIRDSYGPPAWRNRAMYDHLDHVVRFLEAAAARPAPAEPAERDEACGQAVTGRHCVHWFNLGPCCQCGADDTGTSAIDAICPAPTRPHASSEPAERTERGVIAEQCSRKDDHAPHIFGRDVAKQAYRCPGLAARPVPVTADREGPEA